MNDNTFRVDPDLIYMRYADVLLTYAETKIELNEKNKFFEDNK